MPEQEIQNGEGGYIFISHAHKDIHEIRKIRNILEDNGFDPICFYLRCLSDHDEIIDLIKREIDAREWFLLVDSENARRSKWVKTEVEYIHSKNKDKIISLSLEDKAGMLPVLNRLTNSMRVFLSYARKDHHIAKMIADVCLRHDLKVFSDFENIRIGESFADQITAALRDASEKGCVVPIISSDSLKSEYVRNELEFANANRAFIFPVIVDDGELSDDSMVWLASYHYYRLKKPVTKLQIEEIGSIIETILIKRLLGNE